jgi:hypothetical protein
MKEKIRILSNEIEILHQELVDNDKELTVFFCGLNKRKGCKKLFLHMRKETRLRMKLID